MGVEAHDQVILLGDLNFRLSELSRDKIINHANKAEYR